MEVGKVLGVPSQRPSSHAVMEVGKVLGVPSQRPSSLAVMEVGKVLGVPSQRPSVHAVMEVGKVLGVPSQRPSSYAVMEVGKVLIVPSQRPSSHALQVCSHLKQQSQERTGTPRAVGWKGMYLHAGTYTDIRQSLACRPPVVLFSCLFRLDVHVSVG